MLFRILLTFIVVICLYLWANIKKFQLYWKIGGPLGLPLLGNGLKFRPNLIIATLTEFAEKYKSPYYCWLGPKSFIVLNDADSIQAILTSQNCISKTYFYKFLSLYIGDGLFTSNPPKWNSRVKFMKPGFKLKILESFYPEFNKQADYLVKVIEENIKTKNFFIFDLIKNSTINSTYQTIYGDYSKIKTDGIDEVLALVLDIMTAMIDRTYKPWLYIDFIYKQTQIYKQIQKRLQKLLKLADMVITIKKDEVRLKKEYYRKLLADDNNAVLSTPSSFLEYILTYSDDYNLTDIDIRDETLVILGASFETTAIGIYSTIVCLATHPEIQNKLYEELLTNMPDKNTELNQDNLKDLVYLQMCIDETLRVLSPVPLVGRRITEDIEIKKGCIIPKGSDVILDIFNLQRNEKDWGPNAKIFNPDNFLPEKKHHPYSYIPFTKGQRMCLGFKYANMLVKTFLAKIFRTYKITADKTFDELQFFHHISLKIKNNPNFKIELREN